MVYYGLVRRKRADRPQGRRGKKEENMAINTDGSPILLKTQELCQIIMEQPEYLDIRRRLAAFQGDARVQAQFVQLNEKREQLEKKQQEEGAISPAEIAEFERLRDGFVSHPVASAFLQAQEDLHEIRRMVNAYMTHTFETGRLASPQEIIDASCGHNCGCHH